MSDSLIIVIRFITGSELRLKVDKSQTVEFIRKLAQEQLPDDGECTLIYKGKILEDSTNLVDIPGIEENFIIAHYIDPILQQEDTDDEGIDFPLIRMDQRDNAMAFREFLFRQLFNRPRQDPPNFQELVNNLVDMGFEREQCERALRASNYNPNTAATLLVSGNVPNDTNEPPPLPIEDGIEEEDGGESDGEGMMIGPHDLLIDFPGSDYDEEENMGEEDNLDHGNEEEERRENGFIRTALSQEDMANVRHLAELGFDIPTVIQVYLACGKNMETASQCLFSMRE